MRCLRIPYRDENGWAARVTEICDAYGCEEKAHNHRTILENLEKGLIHSFPVKTTFSSVRGTVAHGKIQNWIERRMGLPDTPMKLNPQDQRLYNDIMATPELKKKFDRQVSNAFMNFLHWWEEYTPQPLAVEQTMVTVEKGRRSKGTVDFIALIRESKLDRTLKVDVRSEKYRLIIIDWKTGTRPQDQHKTQIAGYYLKAQKQALIPFLRGNEYYKYMDKPYGIDVYLGGKEAKTIMFNIDEWRFFGAVELYNKAKKLPVDRLNGGILHGGLHDAGTCYFCPYTDRCSTIQRSEMTVLELDNFNKAESPTPISKQS